jgi:uncharacterized protein (TIGR00290 family)
MKEKAIVLWSGGKDSALALFEAQRDWDVVALLTTAVEGYDRISLHGVRTSLVRQQARSLGYALDTVNVSAVSSREEYEANLRTALGRHRRAGVTAVIGGDIFLEPVRRYHEEILATAGLKGVFPLWKRETAELARRVISLGFRAVLCCVDTNALDPSFAGRAYDHVLLADLPPGTDPCGENCEFHSFVIDGPNFSWRIDYKTGERTSRDTGFCFCDLLPGVIR